MRDGRLMQRIANKVQLPPPLFKIWHRRKPQFACPICGYDGPFGDIHSFAGNRLHAVCPKCGALERHRLLWMAVSDLAQPDTAKTRKMLHFAPEKFFRPLFPRLFPNYETADLVMKDVDHHVDITALPFRDETYDFIIASHVLEHVRDDDAAIREIRRILKPQGIAILPVPVVCEKTIEYPAANPREAGHVRAPGVDYPDRYKKYFGRVEVRSSEDFPAKFQVFVYEDRTRWPTPECPLRPPMQGDRHADYVPVCYV
jgi:SAM-dependent methyltransferase